MIALLLVTVLWAFSFSLIRAFLSDVDSSLVTTVRLGLAFLCFLPFLRLSKTNYKSRIELMTIGAIQFGLMYVTYIAAFRHLDAYLVALFSVFTPIWVTLIDGLIHRTLKKPAVWAALIATSGAILIRAGGIPSGNFWYGFFLMQIANLAFAGGQVWFREWKHRHPKTAEKDVFALPYLGGLLLAVTILVFRDGIEVQTTSLSLQQWGVLVYLGIIASGLGFFLWNYGASRVRIGFLAAANNLIIPLGIFIAFLSFDTRPDWATFSIGSLLILTALWIGSKAKASLADCRA